MVNAYILIIGVRACFSNRLTPREISVEEWLFHSTKRKDNHQPDPSVSMVNFIVGEKHVYVTLFMAEDSHLTENLQNHELNKQQNLLKKDVKRIKCWL